MANERDRGDDHKEGGPQQGKDQSQDDEKPRARLDKCAQGVVRKTGEALHGQPLKVHGSNDVGQQKHHYAHRPRAHTEDAGTPQMSPPPDPGVPQHHEEEQWDEIGEERFKDLQVQRFDGKER